jgi:hypothetical protein
MKTARGSLMNHEEEAAGETLKEIEDQVNGS